MNEEYEINKWDLFNEVPRIINAFYDKYDQKPELLTISAAYGEKIAGWTSTAWFIAVSLDETLIPETAKLSMLPEDNHE